MDKTNDVFFTELIESVGKCSAGTLSRVTLSPDLPPKGPTDFESWPAVRVEKADSSRERTGFFFFHRPITVSAKMPVADHKGHMAPCLRARKYLASEIAHHVRVSTDPGIGVEIIFLPHPQDQPIRFEHYVGHGEFIFASTGHHLWCLPELCRGSQAHLEFHRRG